MESLKEYFSYNREFEELPGLFYYISEELKLLHDRKRCVGFLSSDKILMSNGKVSFSDIIDIQEEKKSENIKNLSKIMLGTYLTLSSGFRDFSLVDESWIKDNFYNIQGMLTSTSFPSEYLERSIMSNVTEYYHGYTDLERDISGSKSISKSLRKASYSLDNQYIGENLYERKSAFANPLIYPAILIVLIVIIIIFILVFKV